MTYLGIDHHNPGKDQHSHLVAVQPVDAWWVRMVQPGHALKAQKGRGGDPVRQDCHES
jgi:hypothetical protein